MNPDRLKLLKKSTKYGSGIEVNDDASANVDEGFD
jgi:hypothetical protein